MIDKYVHFVLLQGLFLLGIHPQHLELLVLLLDESVKIINDILLDVVKILLKLLVLIVFLFEFVYEVSYRKEGDLPVLLLGLILHLLLHPLRLGHRLGDHLLELLTLLPQVFLFLLIELLEVFLGDRLAFIIEGNRCQALRGGADCVVEFLPGLLVEVLEHLFLFLLDLLDCPRLLFGVLLALEGLRYFLLGLLDEVVHVLGKLPSLSGGKAYGPGLLLFVEVVEVHPIVRYRHL